MSIGNAMIKELLIGASIALLLFVVMLHYTQLDDNWLWNHGYYHWENVPEDARD